GQASFAVGEHDAPLLGPRPLCASRLTGSHSATGAELHRLRPTSASSHWMGTLWMSLNSPRGRYRFSRDNQPPRCRIAARETVPSSVPVASRVVVFDSLRLQGHAA